MSYNDLVEVLAGALSDEELLGCVLSKTRKRSATPYTKVSIRPVELKRGLFYQVTYHYPTKELHENLLPEEIAGLVERLIDGVFRQAILFTPEADWQVLVSKKGALKLLKHPPTKDKADTSHDRSKHYHLREGVPISFLVELGVMNAEGKVLAKRYNKFRQLNKFIEIVEDTLPALTSRTQEGPLTIVDFGSGKAYLTFALYHYLVEVLGLEVRLIGLDLKEDVVLYCNQVAKKLGYEHLHFYCQDIKDFAVETKIDMVVSLHACDVATDFAFAQAVKWGAQVILAVPCCQHELFNQVAQQTQKPLLEHGVLKERMAALITDAARAKLLETVGYSVTVMEFVDLEHTPKNLLIRAFYKGKRENRSANEYREFQKSWQIRPTLEKLLWEVES